MKHDLPLPDLPDPGPCSGGSDPPSEMRRRRTQSPALDAAEPDISAFLAREAPSAQAIARRFGVPSVEAQDIRQETLEALLKMDEPVRSPATWFWATAEHRRRRIARHCHRSKRFEPELAMLAEQHPAPMPSPEAGIQQRAVEKVLERVAPSRRTVAALRVSGYTETEVAEELGIPLNTVRSRWRRAKKELWAAVAAFLAVIWLWLVSPGRSKRPPAGAGGALPHGRGMFACAALPLVVVAHTRVLPPADPVEVADAPAVAPQNEWLLFSPVLTTHAEGRGTLSSSLPETSSATSNELPSRPISPSVGPSRAPLSSARREAARAHLVAVHRALREQRDRERAREILELYELAFPEDPFPRKHAELAAALKAP